MGGVTRCAGSSWAAQGCRLVSPWLWYNGRWICIICDETLYLTLLHRSMKRTRAIAGLTCNFCERYIRGNVFAHARHGDRR